MATAVFLASLAAFINTCKVPPVLPALMAEPDADMVTGGWFTSVSSLAGIVLAVPAAMVLARLGLERRARASGWPDSWFREGRCGKM